MGDGRCRDEAPVLDRVRARGAPEAEQRVDPPRRSEGEIRRRRAGDDHLHLRALPVHRARVAGGPLAVEDAEQAGEMAAGRSAHGADSVGIDPELLRVVAHETHRALRVLEMRGMPEAGRGAVIDSEHRVAGRGQGHGVDLLLPALLQRRGVQAQLPRPAASRDEDDAVAVGVLRVVHVHQQREPGVHAEDDVALHASLRPGRVHRAAGQERRQDDDENPLSHFPASPSVPSVPPACASSGTSAPAPFSRERRRPRVRCHHGPGRPCRTQPTG